MTEPPGVSRHAFLSAQLSWFVRLRWLVGVAVVVAAVVNWRWAHWYGRPGLFLALGGGILLYNVGLWLGVRPVRAPEPGKLVILSWLQILLDLGCLAALTAWTGAAHSPLLGFFAFHMIFASLLLPPWMACTGAALAWGMLGAGLLLTEQWPPPTDDVAIFSGWAFALLVMVYLANHLARDLRRHEQRLAEQGAQISTMSDELNRQRRTMIQQEKMAALGQLAAGVAHEIANPLACMDSLLQLSQRRPGRASPEPVAQLREQVMRISEIVLQLTRFSQPQESQRKVISVTALVERALQMVQLDSRFRTVPVHREVSPERDLVCVQVHALEQVMVNLILNALDAMAGSAAPCLTLRTGSSADECFIEVADNGYGIRADHLARLFEPFFTTKPVGRGTGLGLAISYTTVQSHGGRIEATSYEGRGATFRVYLPKAGCVSEGRRVAFLDSDS